MTARFLEAIDFARKVLKHLVQDRQLRTTDIEPTEVLFQLALPVICGTDEKGFYMHCADGALAWLVATAEGDRGAFDLACRIVGSRLIHDDPLPAPARLFAAEVLNGSYVPPARNRRARTFTSNVMLYWTAKLIESDFGLSLSRNDESSAHSACDAVSVALERLGHTKTYRAIKDLCYHHSAAPMRQMAHEFRGIMESMSAEKPEMTHYWKSQAPWGQ